MKNNKVLKSLFLATASFTIGCTYNNLFGEVGITKYPPNEYENTCLTAYYWDQDGNTWILLGKEKRGYKTRRQFRKHGSRPPLRIEWTDFCGGKELEDENSWQTAVREASEETAGQLNISEAMIFDYKIMFTYRGRRNRDTIHYIVPVQYIDPRTIAQAAANLRKQGLGKGIEKLEWQWVKLQDLFDGTTGLDLYWSLEGKLKNPAMRQFLEFLIKKGELTYLEGIISREPTLEKGEWPQELE